MRFLRFSGTTSRGTSRDSRHWPGLALFRGSKTTIDVCHPRTMIRKNEEFKYTTFSYQSNEPLVVQPFFHSHPVTFVLLFTFVFNPPHPPCFRPFRFVIGWTHCSTRVQYGSILPYKPILYSDKLGLPSRTREQDVRAVAASASALALALIPAQFDHDRLIAVLSSCSAGAYQAD